MAEGTAYADLNLQAIYSFPTVPHPCSESNTPQCAPKHRVVLGVASALILLLGSTLITLVSWGFTGYSNIGTTRCLADSEFRLQLKHFACNSLDNNTEEDTKVCKICPQAWNLHGDKCYWISEEKKTWAKSQEDCKGKNSTLLVIQNTDRAFMEYETGKTEIAFWLGLTVNYLGTWQWADGSLFKEELFSVSGSAEENSCALRKNTVVNSESCDSLHSWICEQIPFHI